MLRQFRPMGLVKSYLNRLPSQITKPTLQSSRSYHKSVFQRHFSTASIVRPSTRTFSTTTTPHDKKYSVQGSTKFISRRNTFQEIPLFESDPNQSSSQARYARYAGLAFGIYLVVDFFYVHALISKETYDSLMGNNLPPPPIEELEERIKTLEQKIVDQRAQNELLGKPDSLEERMKLFTLSSITQKIRDSLTITPLTPKELEEMYVRLVRLPFLLSPHWFPNNPDMYKITDCRESLTFALQQQWKQEALRQYYTQVLNDLDMQNESDMTLLHAVLLSYMHFFTSVRKSIPLDNSAFNTMIPFAQSEFLERIQQRNLRALEHGNFQPMYSLDDENKEEVVIDIVE